MITRFIVVGISILDMLEENFVLKFKGAFLLTRSLISFASTFSLLFEIFISALTASLLIFA